MKLGILGLLFSFILVMFVLGADSKPPTYYTVKVYTPTYTKCYENVKNIARMEGGVIFMVNGKEVTAWHVPVLIEEQ